MRKGLVGGKKQGHMRGWEKDGRTDRQRRENPVRKKLK